MEGYSLLMSFSLMMSFGFVAGGRSLPLEYFLSLSNYLFCPRRVLWRGGGYCFVLYHLGISLISCIFLGGYVEFRCGLESV